MEIKIDDFTDAHRHIVTALNQCKTNDAAVVIIVLGRVLAELSCRAGMPKETLLNGLSETYDMTILDEQAEAGEPH